jgi:hypothetical protein
MTLEGKGFFLWQIPKCEHGDAGSIAAQAKSAGLSHLLIKVADGTMIYNGTWGDPKDYTTPVINALRALGIRVWGWHYVYGDNPNGEANVAIARIRQYDLDGYVIDAEKEYKDRGKKVSAKKFMTQLRNACPDLEIALSSYRYPSLHPQIPWAEFLENCTLNMPQVYWIKAHNPGDQLAKCVHEFQAMHPSRPVVPTGAASKESGWQPNEAEILEFIRTAKELNLTGVNFWEWSDARSGNLPGVWEAIRDYPWAGVPAPKDICANYISALNSHDIEQVISLYTPSAVHINALRTVQGLENIRTWYSQLFNEVLPDGKFTLTGYSGSGNSRHMTWTATSSKGSVQNGNDTFGLASGKINYHYSFFMVTK